MAEAGNPKRSAAPLEGRSTAELEELLNLPALERFLADRLPAVTTRLRVDGQPMGGVSNVTVFVTRGADERWVVRRPPAGPLLPTAHDVLREYRFLSALRGTAVPVAEPVLACEDASIMGASFYLMKRVDGVVVNIHVPPEVDTPLERRRMSEAAVDALAALHAVDWTNLGLPGKPEGYLDRQLKRWTGQLEMTPTAERLRGLDDVTAWVKANRPESGPATIVHGDWGIHNMIFASTPPTSLLAITDWEMATLGDPLADVGWMLRDWGIVPEKGIRNPAKDLTAREGFPPVEEMVARYEEKSHRSLSKLKFYAVFSMWKEVIITEGLYSGYLAGQTADPRVAAFEHETPETIDRILDLIVSG